MERKKMSVTLPHAYVRRKINKNKIMPEQKEAIPVTREWSDYLRNFCTDHLTT